MSVDQEYIDAYRKGNTGPLIRRIAQIYENRNAPISLAPAVETAYRVAVGAVLLDSIRRDAEITQAGAAAVRSRLAAIVANRGVDLKTPEETAEERLTRMTGEVMSGFAIIDSKRAAIDWLATVEPVPSDEPSDPVGIGADEVAFVQGVLNRQGFPAGPVDGEVGPVTEAAVWRFQHAYAVELLTLDGVLGPKTLTAVQAYSQNRLLSANVRYEEIGSGLGRGGTGEAYVDRRALLTFEKVREMVGPTRINSAYRDPVYNRRVGGASRSRHTYAGRDKWGKTWGDALDLGRVIPVNTMRSAGFRGVGRYRTFTHGDLGSMRSW